jgi:hypothetical protein
VAGVTSDTTNVMPATVRELSQMPLFEGCICVPCGCHVMNSYLLDQVKQVKAINSCLHWAKALWTSSVSRLSARSFSGMPFLLSTASPLELLHLLLPTAYRGHLCFHHRQCLCCRFNDSALSQLQLPVLV